MSAETLRRAAGQMRLDAERYGAIAGTFIPAVADWLDRSASLDEELRPLGMNESTDPWALAVARAYLGEFA